MTNTPQVASSPPIPSAAELRQKPPHERTAILEAQAALAEATYRTDATLTDFEAFIEGDLNGDHSSPGPSSR